ncbi:MAG: multiheme c-type cytochrome, partial [Nitrospirales bacterium]|nr:multiheme c-type cytochrome [Nitrospirales bacterium]
LASPNVAVSQDDSPEIQKESAGAAHRKLFLENRFPSAATCRTCHGDHYREWSVSPHAYAQMSPVFNAMHGAILKLTNGTNGDFCIRCHTQVGMNLGEPLFMSNIDRHPTSREGITCIVCHRVNQAYGKESGRLKIVEGDLFDPIFGPKGNAELQRVLESDEYQVNPERGKPGRAIHAKVEKFFALIVPGFCGTCHDVNLLNGFRLEEAFSEYKTSPAARRGITCQDCHMGLEPGKPSGYASAPAARVGDVKTKPRKRTNHMFPGPDHSIIHPGIFPHNTEASELATIREWLTFDYKAGWGTDEFEDEVPEDAPFPERWSSIDDRYDAREILDEQIALLDEYYAERKKVLQVGFKLGEIVTEQADEKGLRFKVQVKNGIDGHGVPTGFDAERLVYLRVIVTDRGGTIVFKSGDADPNGDLRDTHSLYVHNGELPLDQYLFSLQSKFIIRNLRGSESEQILSVNSSFDPLPFIRPLTQSSTLIGRPVTVRKHRNMIEPNGSRWARYKVEERFLTGRGPYQAHIELIVGMVPVNLVNEISE